MNLRKPVALALIALLPAGAAAQTRNISTPVARQAVLKTVEALLAEKPKTTEGPVALKDPFNPPEHDLQEDYDPNSAAQPVQRRSDADLLEQIAAQINPTGSVTLGGEPYLLFTERRQKIGDKVTVSIDGIEYEVEIVNIDKSRFWLRYNNLETTRSIK